MPAGQTEWAIGLLVVPLVALIWFMRRRRRTVDYAESRTVKTRLPWWVKNVETLLLLAFGYLWTVAGFGLYALFCGNRSAAHAPLVGASAVYVVVGLGFILLPLAMLSANAASWTIPILRKANQQAFSGTQVSFKSANIGLIRFALVSVPFGLAALLIAAIEPWTR